MVQRGPFVDSGAGRIAYVVENGMAHRTSIEIGASSIASLQIIDGLKEGDTVIISERTSWGRTTVSSSQHCTFLKFPCRFSR